MPYSVIKCLISGDRTLSQEFTGYHLRGTQYEEVASDEQGRIYSPVTGLYLAIHKEWLRWMTQEGDIVPTPQELAGQERQRAEQERQRADQAEQQLEAYRRRFGELE